MTVHVRNVVASMTVMDADSLLSPAVLERIVSAVTQAQMMARADERSRKRDTKIADECCDKAGHDGDGA